MTQFEDSGRLTAGAPARTRMRLPEAHHFPHYLHDYYLLDHGEDLRNLPPVRDWVAETRAAHWNSLTCVKTVARCCAFYELPSILLRLNEIYQNTRLYINV